GKTTTLDVLATMVPRPFRTENMRAPVLFRVVDQQQPILLLDEVDTYLHQADELRGLLNAGHKRGACAYRCEGAGNAIRAFQAFAPAEALKARIDRKSTRLNSSHGSISYAVFCLKKKKTKKK